LNSTTHKMAKVAVVHLNNTDSCLFMTDNITDGHAVWDRVVSRIDPSDIYQVVAYSSSNTNLNCLSVNTTQETLASFFWMETANASELWSGCKAYDPLYSNVTCELNVALQEHHELICIPDNNECLPDYRQLYKCLNYGSMSTSDWMLVSAFAAIFAGIGAFYWLSIKYIPRRVEEDQLPILQNENDVNQEDTELHTLVDNQ